MKYEELRYENLHPGQGKSMRGGVQLYLILFQTITRLRPNSALEDLS